MLTKLNKDKTLKAQMNRMAKFAKTNKRSIGLYAVGFRFEKCMKKSSQNTITATLNNAKEYLQARWRSVNVMKGFLTKLKKKLPKNVFLTVCFISQSLINQYC